MSIKNKVILIGNLGSDIEVKTFDNGSVGNVSIATNESYKNKDGERVTKTEWTNLSFNGKRFEKLFQYLTKGTTIGIEGSLRTRSWDGEDGNKRYLTEVVVSDMTFLGSDKKESKGESVESTEEDDDGLPF